MARKRNKPIAPVGDIGPETEAALAGCIVRTVSEPGKTPTRRKYRDHLLEHMARPRQYRGETKPPQITGRQRDAGIALHDAWCETERRPAQSGVVVDVTPDWDGIILQQVERTWAYSRVSALIPRECRDVVAMVVHQQIPVGHDAGPRTAEMRLELLRIGLTAVADGLGLT